MPLRSMLQSLLAAVVLTATALVGPAVATPSSSNPTCYTDYGGVYRCDLTTGSTFPQSYTYTLSPGTNVQNQMYFTNTTGNVMQINAVVITTSNDDNSFEEACLSFTYTTTLSTAFVNCTSKDGQSLSPTWKQMTWQRSTQSDTWGVTVNPNDALQFSFGTYQSSHSHTVQIVVGSNSGYSSHVIAHAATKNALQDDAQTCSVGEVGNWKAGYWGPWHNTTGNSHYLLGASFFSAGYPYQPPQYAAAYCLYVLYSNGNVKWTNCYLPDSGVAGQTFTIASGSEPVVANGEYAATVWAFYCSSTNDWADLNSYMWIY